MTRSHLQFASSAPFGYRIRMLLRTAIHSQASKMTRTSSFILPLLAILNNVGAYRVPRLPVSVFSRSFMASTLVLKMGDVEEASSSAEEKAVKPFAAHQVYIGNLPFSVDEQRLSDIVSERTQGCVSSCPFFGSLTQPPSYSQVFLPQVLQTPVGDGQVDRAQPGVCVFGL